jgi:CheY-like chemotaxis protein
MGIQPAVRERMFEPFYTTKTVGRGTGLGLATIWHVVTTAGGHIDVASTPGEGTAFHISLPTGRFEGEPHAAKQVKQRQAGAPLSILLVDDEKVIVDTMSALLIREGHRVKAVMDGQQGWEYLQTRLHEHELLIVDLNMPGIDGLELVSSARKAGYAGRILVISGRLASNMIERMKDKGVDAVLPKPFNREELLGAVAACLHT